MKIETYDIGDCVKARLITGEVFEGRVAAIKTESYQPSGYGLINKIYYTIDNQGKRKIAREYEIISALKNK